jgi:NADH-quinone oxidoreductase subunit A
VYTYLNFKKKNDLEKRSPYECGFNAFNDARSGYYINFYLISLLYILFDLEITLLFPYCLSLYFQNIYTFIIIFVFLILLGLNFLYEFKVGALQWK